MNSVIYIFRNGCEYFCVFALCLKFHWDSWTSCWAVDFSFDIYTHHVPIFLKEEHGKVCDSQSLCISVCYRSGKDEAVHLLPGEAIESFSVDKFRCCVNSSKTMLVDCSFEYAVGSCGLLWMHSFSNLRFAAK